MAAATEGRIGYGVTFVPEAGTLLATVLIFLEFRSFRLAGARRDFAEISHTLSPAMTKEFIGGMLDPGGLECECNLKVSATVPWGNGDFTAGKIQFPPRGDEEIGDAITGSFCLESMDGNIPLNEACTASFRLKVSGPLVPVPGGEAP